MAVKELTKRALAALSGNRCAFPECLAPIYDTAENKFVGRYCHIKGQSEGGPRYDASQTDEERDGFYNVMVMCGPHHDIIDDLCRVDEFTVEVLLGYKRVHESRSENSIFNQDLLEQLIRKMIEIHAPAPAVPVVSPVVECEMSRADNEGKIDQFDFRVRLRNDGPLAITDWSVEIEVPNAYASGSGSAAIIDQHARGPVRLYRHTQAAFEPFTIYRGDTSQVVLRLDFNVRHDQYAGMSDSIVVTVSAGDSAPHRSEYPIANYFSPERLKQLGMS